MHFSEGSDVKTSPRMSIPLIKVNDSLKVDIATGKIEEFIKFDTGMFWFIVTSLHRTRKYSSIHVELMWFVVVAGNMAMITGGHNVGRVGLITHRDRHPGSFDIVHIKDSAGHSFATRYVFY